jgi:small-conductance mechanosensitive channel
MTEYLPPWLQDAIRSFTPVIRLVLIIAAAWILRKVTIKLINRLNLRPEVPAELVIGLRRTTTFIITAAAVLMILEGLGFSATVLWTAFTGFAAVAAVAFFAAWSVLSNIFCTFLILMARPFRLHDQIELLESGDKPGLKGQVTDVNLIYTTLRETTPEGEPGSVLRIPNSLFFQRVLRRWERK